MCVYELCVCVYEYVCMCECECVRVYVCAFLTEMQTRLSCLRNPQLYVRERRLYVDKPVCNHRLLVSSFSLKNSPAPEMP